MYKTVKFKCSQPQLSILGPWNLYNLDFFFQKKQKKQMFLSVNLLWLPSSMSLQKNCMKNNYRVELWNTPNFFHTTLPFYATQIISPFFNLRISANGEILIKGIVSLLLNLFWVYSSSTIKIKPYKSQIQSKRFQICINS